MDDNVDDLCYAVDICNRFCLLTMKTTPAVESSVEEFPTKPGSKLITKAIKSNGGLKRAVSSDDCDGSSLDDLVGTVVEKRRVGTKEHINHCTERAMTTSERVISQTSNTEVVVAHGNNKGSAIA